MPPVEGGGMEIIMAKKGKEIQFDISKRIFELMEERGVSQKELSERTGISTSTISDWKNKGNAPTSEKISSICNALNITADVIFNDVEIEHVKTRVITEESELWDFVHAYDNLSARAQKRVLAYAMAMMKVEA